MDKKEKKKLQEKAKSRGIAAEGLGGYERHIVFCTGSSCCSKSKGEKVFKHLQKRLSRLEKSGRHIYCTEAECLRICKGGPLAVVYPEGVWYGELTVEACDRIIEEHLLNGRIVEEYAFARNPLTPLPAAARTPHDE